MPPLLQGLLIKICFKTSTISLPRVKKGVPPCRIGCGLFCSGSSSPSTCLLASVHDFVLSLPTLWASFCFLNSKYFLNFKNLLITTHLMTPPCIFKVLFSFEGRKRQQLWNIAGLKEERKDFVIVTRDSQSVLSTTGWELINSQLVSV